MFGIFFPEKLKQFDSLAIFKKELKHTYSNWNWTFNALWTFISYCGKALYKRSIIIDKTNFINCITYQA